MKLVSTIVAFVLCCSGCKDNNSDTSSGDGTEDSEGVEPPENVAGTYLVCSSDSTPTDEAPAASTKCMIARADNGKKINISKLASKSEWTTTASSISSPIITVSEANNDPMAHVIYTFNGKTPRESQRAMRDTYIELTFTRVGETEPRVLGAPLEAIRSTNFLHGDIDGDGFLDLVDRHTDGSVTTYFFDVTQKPEFPFREEKQPDLNWNFSNYFIGKYKAGPGTKNMVVGRTYTGTFNYLEYKPKGNTPNRGMWYDPGEMPDKMLNFTVSAVGSFTGLNDTFMTRSVEGVLNHYFMGAPPQQLPGTWDAHLLAAFDSNGDKLTDLLTVAADGSVQYHHNVTPPGTFFPKFDTPVALNYNLASVTHLVSADFTAEGKDSLIGRTEEGALILLKTSVEKTNLVWTMTSVSSDGWNFEDFFAMDVDKDGKYEFVGRNSDNKIRSTELP
jgi:hypothetical protein